MQCIHQCHMQVNDMYIRLTNKWSISKVTINSDNITCTTKVAYMHDNEGKRTEKESNEPRPVGDVADVEGDSVPSRHPYRVILLLQVEHSFPNALSSSALVFRGKTLAKSQKNLCKMRENEKSLFRIDKKVTNSGGSLQRSLARRGGHPRKIQGKSGYPREWRERGVNSGSGIRLDREDRSRRRSRSITSGNTPAFDTSPPPSRSTHAWSLPCG